MCHCGRRMRCRGTTRKLRLAGQWAETEATESHRRAVGVHGEGDIMASGGLERALSCNMHHRVMMQEKTMGDG